jgi:hypothetical protein
MPHPADAELVELVPGPSALPAPSALVCERCFAPAVAQWRRRLTDRELGVELAREQERRAQAFVLRDTQLPPPDFGPLPTGADYTRAVYACGDHAIGLDDAALIHQPDCTGPHGDHTPHPQCTCEPESLPEPEPTPVSPGPAHWT